MAGRDWSEKSDSSIEEKLCVCVGRRLEEGGGRGWRDEARVGRRVKRGEWRHMWGGGWRQERQIWVYVCVKWICGKREECI